MREESKNWLMQAEADLITANNSIKSKDYYASVFWSQQAVEKVLKSLIIEKEGVLIKIHDLVILGRKAGLPKDLLLKCEKLSKVYIESRYGVLDNKIPAEKFKRKDAYSFIKISREVLKWIKKILK